MGVDLGNLSISLDRFNEVASGKYNIGQLKLSEDGTSVYRTNNHKTWTIFNNTKISAVESLAIKSAFCRALANEGLSKDDISDIKEKLGISGPEIDILRPGVIKPLSAAEVREIIDEYAGKINENRAAKANEATLKTSDDFYKGVSEKTLQSRAETRDSINASTLNKGIESGASKTLNTLMDVIRYLEPGRGEKPTKDMTNLAKEIRAAMKRTRDILPRAGSSITVKDTPISLVRGNDDKISIKLMLDDGNTLSFSTNLNKYDLHLAMGDLEAKQYASGVDKPIDDEPVEKEVDTKKLSTKIKGGFELCSNKEKFNNQVMRKLAKDPRLAKIHESAQNAKNVTEEQIKEKIDALEAKIRNDLRSTITTNIIEPLQQVLKQSGVNSEDRFNILSMTRSILDGDQVSEASRNALQNVINCIIDKQPIPEKDKIAAGLPNLSDPSENKQKPVQQGDAADDLNVNLNINDWLANN